MLATTSGCPNCASPYVGITITLTFKAAQTGKATEEDVNKVERQKCLLLSQRILLVSVQSAASGFLFSAPTQFSLLTLRGNTHSVCSIANVKKKLPLNYIKQGKDKTQM